MTANELADKLMESNSVSWGSCTHEQHDNDKHFKEQAATMLRQQAKEIEILKKLIDANNLQSDIGQLDTRSYLIGRYDGLRELTDEEITEIGLAHGAFFTESKHRLWGDDLEIHDFARAILKKAGEK
jgi:hypothetical protein